MVREMVDSVRAFNRAVTARIGALEDEYLARARPLGASRLLWEIGTGADTTKLLRSRLDLDSGYLSRLLRSLEAEGLIALRPTSDDARVKAITLTAEGEQEWEALDEGSDRLAASLVEPLAPRQRTRLVEAMDTVARLLDAGLVEIAVADPASDDAQHCLNEYFAELDRRFTDGFDPEISISADVEELTEPAGLLVLARLRHEPVGCGAVKFKGTEPAEIKRMWIGPSVRGLGVGRRLLHTLETLASDRGVVEVRLETNESLSEAISLYRSAGYEEVEAFNDEPFAHHWFRKILQPTRTSRSPQHGSSEATP